MVEEIRVVLMCQPNASYQQEVCWGYKSNIMHCHCMQAEMVTFYYTCYHAKL